MKLSSGGTTIHITHATTGYLVHSITAADALEDVSTEIRVLGAAGVLVQGGMQMQEALDQAWDEKRKQLEEKRAWMGGRSAWMEGGISRPQGHTVITGKEGGGLRTVGYGEAARRGLMIEQAGGVDVERIAGPGGQRSENGRAVDIGNETMEAGMNTEMKTNITDQADTGFSLGVEFQNAAPASTTSSFQGEDSSKNAEIDREMANVPEGINTDDEVQREEMKRDIIDRAGEEHGVCKEEDDLGDDVVSFDIVNVEEGGGERVRVYFS
jgi:hypothetical protein